MHKFEVIYKFGLMVSLLVGLGIMCLSGAALYFHLNLPFLMPLHLAGALLLISTLLLHIHNRKNKLVKIKTQFADFLFRNKHPSYCNLDRLIMSTEQCTITQICQRFGLEQQAFCALLASARIPIADLNQPLRHLFTHNDEKIFAIVSLALQQAFPLSHNH